MLSSLRDQEFDESDADLGLFGVKLLVAAQFEQLLVVIRLSSDLASHLGKHELELDGANAVKN